jgi:hypothetical protein
LPESNAAPWEVSSSAIAGMPYLASFLAAVVEEMRSDGANAQVKATAGEFAFAPSQPASQRSLVPLVAGVGVLILLAVIAIFLLR